MNDEKLKEYVFECFDNWQLNKLLKIKDNVYFIYFAEQIIKETFGLGYKASFTTNDVKRINSELGKVKDAINGMSDDVRFMFNYGLGIESFKRAARIMMNSTYSDDGKLPADLPNPVQEILNGLDRVHVKKGLTRRLQIGDDAKYLFDMFNIKTDRTSSGDFTMFLTIILSVIGVKHGANDLAIETLKR